MSMDAQALRKKLSRTCDGVARALLGSLLMYVSERAAGPQRAAGPGHTVGCLPPSQEAGQRPTRFQLLQAKFMGTGREHHLKRTREVGRLTSKDKQGPSRSLVSATINKLLEKTKEGASSPGQRSLLGEKPRWAPPGGKSTVKSILRKFLAAEEKEKKEKEAGEKPPRRQPGAARGLLPRIVGRSSILSKLRERFEQSSCLHSEASLLPLHKEGRKSLQKKMHRPELRVLHTATMATSCTRTPPARFLACTAEPLPALSIATVVCSPRSWLSHCAKVRHLESRHWPRRDTSMSPNSGDTEPSRDKMPGAGPPNEQPRGQAKPSKSSSPQVATHGDRQPALSTTEGTPQPASWASWEALPDHVPLLSPFRPASPRGAGPAEGDRTVEPMAKEPGGHIWGLKEEGAGEAPDVTMTVCSSEDEAESETPASDRKPLFATQRHLPEQGPAAQIPPLATPSVQAARRMQLVVESPQITLRLPVVHEMPAPPGPLQSTSPGEDGHPQASGGHALGVSAHAGFPTGTEDGLASGRPCPPCGTPASRGASSEPGSPEALRATACLGPGGPQLVLAPDSPKSTLGGEGTDHSLVSSREGSSPRAGSELSCQQHLLPESDETLSPTCSTSPRCPTFASQGHPGGSSRQGPAPRGPESPTLSGRRVLCGREECQGTPTESAQPLRAAQEDGGCESSTNRLCPSATPPQPGGRARRATAPGGKVPHPTTPPWGSQTPEDKTAPPGDARAPEDRTAPTRSAQDPQDRTAPTRRAQDPQDRTAPTRRAQDPQDRTAPTRRAQDPQDRTAPTRRAQDPQDRTAPTRSAQDPQDRTAPTRSAQDPQDRTAPTRSAQDPQDWTAPTRSAQDPQDRTAPTRSAQDPQDRTAPTRSAQDPQDRTAPTRSAQDPQDRTAPTWSAQDPQDRTALPGRAQDPQDRTAPTWSAQDPQDRTAPTRSAQDPQDRTAPTRSAQDPQDRTAPPGSAQDPQDRTAPTWSAQDPQDRTAPTWSAQDPQDRTALPGRAQDPQDRTAPTWSAQDPQDRTAPTWSAQDPQDRTAPTWSAQDPQDRTAPTWSAQDPQDRTTPTWSYQDPQDRTAPTWSAQDPQDRTAPTWSAQDPQDRTAPPGSAQDPQDRTAPTWSAQDPQDRTAPTWSAQDPQDRTAPPGSAQDPQDRTAPTRSAQDPQDRTAPTWSAQDPQDRTAPPGSAQDPQDRTAPTRSAQDPQDRTALLGRAGAPKDHSTEEWTAVDGEAHRALSAAAAGRGPLGDAPPPAPGEPRFLPHHAAPAHRSPAAQGYAWEDRRGPPPAGGPLTAGPKVPLDPSLALGPWLCVPPDSASAGPRSPGPRGAASGVQPPSRPTPHSSPSGSLGQPQGPVADQPVQDSGGLQPAAHAFPGGAGPPRLSGPAPEQEAQPAGPRPAQAESRGPTRPGPGKPERLFRPEEGVTGQERSLQTQEPGASGDRGAAGVEQPCQPRVRGQQRPLGPHGRPVRSPTREGDPRADRSPAAPSRTPEGSYSLAAQGQAQAQELAGGTASQAWGQPGTSADGAPTSGEGGGSWRSTRRVSGRGSLGGPSPAAGSRRLVGQSSAAPAPEPADSSALTPQPPAQEGLPDTPGAEGGLSEGEHHRRSVHCTKYKAQSFRDQQAFDLSFRPTLLRASDTFQVPK